MQGFNAQPYNGVYLVPCNAGHQLKLKINNIDYAIPLSQMSLEVGGGQCQLLINGQPGNVDVWILGGKFFNEFFIGFCELKMHI